MSTARPVDQRTDAEVYREFNQRAVAERVPVDGSIELTHRCNLRCVHCYLGDQHEIRKHRREEMTTAQVKSVIDQLVEAGTLNLTFSGGDPMVRKDFPEVYRYAVSQGLLVSVFCDGVLITDRIIEVFNDFPPRKVEISIYGATRETYERITQVRGSFDRCLAGIRRLKENGRRFLLKSVLMTANEHELEQMRAMAKRFGVDFYFDSAVFPCLPHGDNGGASNVRSPGARTSVEVAPPSPPGIRGRNTDGDDPRRTPLRLRVDPDRAVALELSDPARVEELASLYQRTKDLPPSPYLYSCGAGLTTCHIDPYGNLQPCTISTNVGYNILDGSFMEGWNGPVAKIREIPAEQDSTCRTCELRSMCPGCPAMFAPETGSGHRKSAYICRLTHTLFEGIRPAVEANHEGH